MRAIVAILSLVLLGLILYRFYRTERFGIRQPVAENTATLYFFYTNWCGFCKKAMPEWEKLELELRKNPVVGKIKVKPVRVDAEANQTLAEEFGINGYPMVRLETVNGIRVYDKQITSAGLMQFLQTNLV